MHLALSEQRRPGDKAQVCSLPYYIIGCIRRAVTVSVRVKVTVYVKVYAIDRVKTEGFSVKVRFYTRVRCTWLG